MIRRSSSATDGECQVILPETVSTEHQQPVRSAKRKDTWKKHVVENPKAAANQPLFQSVVIRAVLNLCDQQLWWTQEVLLTLSHTKDSSARTESQRNYQ